MVVVLVDPTDNSLYAPLPEPFSTYRLTRMRASDAQQIHTILRDSKVAGNLSSVPEPYTLKHAEAFVSSFIKKDSNHNADIEASLCADWSLSVIRDMSGILVGSVNIRRNRWEGSDPNKAATLVAENEKKVAGNESIQYSIGKSFEPRVAVQSH